MEKHKSKVWEEQVSKSEEPDENKTANDAVTWDEFIQNTTIHGVRYIFDSSLRIRRFVRKTVADLEEGHKEVIVPSHLKDDRSSRSCKIRILESSFSQTHKIGNVANFVFRNIWSFLLYLHQIRNQGMYEDYISMLNVTLD